MRVVLAEDSVLLREGLVRLLEEAGCAVVAAVGDGDELREAVREHRPDVAVVDVRMPPSFTDEGLRAGGTVLDPTVVAQLFAARRARPLDRLTPREREVLALMAEGRTNAAVARALVVTPKAVEKHVAAIFTKLDLPPSTDDHRRVLAVLEWLRSDGPR